MGAVIAAQVVIAGNYIGDDTGRNLTGLVIMLGFGAFIGLVNGLVTTLLRVPSFIVTLAMMLALTGLVRYQSGGAADAPPNDDFRQLGRGVVEDVPIVEVIPYPLIVLAVLVRRGRLADAPPVRPDPARRRRQPRCRPRRRRPRVVGQDPGLHALLGRRHRLRGAPRRLRRRPPQRRPGLRVRRHHRRRARRRRPRRRTRLGALRRGRRVRARAALHAADRPRGRVHVARHRAGPDHHRRGRRRGPRLDLRPPAVRSVHTTEPTPPTPGTNTGENR